MHLHREAEVLRVEHDGLIHIEDLVANVDRSHPLSFLLSYFSGRGGGLKRPDWSCLEPHSQLVHLIFQRLWQTLLQRARRIAQFSLGLLVAAQVADTRAA